MSSRTLESIESIKSRQRSTAPPKSSANGIARGLGWFSLGLGVAELIAPRAISRIAGAGKKDSLIRSYGVREIVAGVGVLATTHSAGWLWARVAGDAVDLASLGAARAASRDGGKKKCIGDRIGGGRHGSGCVVRQPAQQSGSRTSRGASGSEPAGEPLARRMLPILAQFRKPSAIYRSSEVGAKHRRSRFPLDGIRTWRNRGGVER